MTSTWRTSRMAALAAVLLATTGEARAQRGPDVVNVHTTREKELIEPLLRVFEGLSGVKLNITYLTSDPIGRLEADAAAGKVDFFIAAELSQLVAAKDAGITEPVSNQDLANRVPEAFRDAEGHWFGLTRRYRVVAASRDRVAQKAFTYEELAEPKWKGKLCVGSGSHPSNVLLVASMIAHKGEPAAEAWLRGVKANLALKPAGSERDQVQNVHAGRCDVALVNSDTVGSLRAAQRQPEMQAVGRAVEIRFPNAVDRGAHVSISGMALIKDAPGLNTAALLIDFLTSEPAQFIHARDGNEHPVREGVKPSGLVESWGTPKGDAIALGEIVRHQRKAQELIKRVGFDNGPGS